MKKFIVLMIALFIGFGANAQIVPVYDKDGSLLKHEFHLGEYVFKTSFADGLLLHQRFSVETNTEEEKKPWNRAVPLRGVGIKTARGHR